VKRIFLIVAAASVLSGCIATGGLERCYGIKVPFVIVGPCLRTLEARDPGDQFRQSALYQGK
jgi:hypothetical protein